MHVLQNDDECLIVGSPCDCGRDSFEPGEPLRLGVDARRRFQQLPLTELFQDLQPRPIGGRTRQLGGPSQDRTAARGVGVIDERGTETALADARFTLDERYVRELGVLPRLPRPSDRPTLACVISPASTDRPYAFSNEYSDK